ERHLCVARRRERERHVRETLAGEPRERVVDARAEQHRHRLAVALRFALEGGELAERAVEIPDDDEPGWAHAPSVAGVIARGYCARQGRRILPSTGLDPPGERPLR